MIMSGFFWLGYWTAASSDYATEPVVVSQPRGEQADSLSDGDDESNDESSAETSSKEYATDNDYHHWVEL